MAQHVIPRKDWGARYREGFGSRPLPVTEFWLHHSVTIAPDLVPPFTDDDRAIRTLEDIGQQRFNGGISYTFPVTPVGRIYEGLGIDRLGAHTKGHNTVGAAFVLVGDYSKNPPTPEQEHAIALRMVEEHRAGNATRHTLNGGHRQVYPTSCPGDAAFARIPAINALAERLWADPDYQEDPMAGINIDDLVTRIRRAVLFDNVIQVIDRDAPADAKPRFMSAATALRVAHAALRSHDDELAALRDSVAELRVAQSNGTVTKDEVLAEFRAAADAAAKARFERVKVVDEDAVEPEVGQ